MLPGDPGSGTGREVVVAVLVSVSAEGKGLL